MFVLKNAWAALGRVKWRTALIALLALLVSFSAAVDLAVIRADDTANNETYQSQKATAVIRPTAQTKAKRDGADSSYTDKYLTWEKYSTYATAAQSNSVTSITRWQRQCRCVKASHCRRSPRKTIPAKTRPAEI